MDGKSPHSTGLCPLLGPLPKKWKGRLRFSLSYQYVKKNYKHWYIIHEKCSQTDMFFFTVLVPYIIFHSKEEDEEEEEEEEEEKEKEEEEEGIARRRDRRL